VAYFSFLRAPLAGYAYNPGTQQLATLPSTQSSFHISGGTPSVSANGTADGIVWLVEYHRDDVAVLRAFMATDLSVELYDTTLSADRDRPGLGIKHAVPTVADGLVLFGARNELDIYGLLAN
jgi:hypothetical protein